MSDEQPDTTPGKKPRGFALMDPDRRREIAAMGGRTAQSRGTAHRFTPETGAAAGRAAQAGGRAHRFTVDEAREAGRKGGRAPKRTRSGDGA